MRGSVGEDDHRMTSLFEALEARLDVGKSLEVVVLVYERVFLVRLECPPCRCQRVVKRFTGDPLEVLMALHGCETERVL